MLTDLIKKIKKPHNKFEVLKMENKKTKIKAVVYLGQFVRT